ncbi:MAG: type II toxin-antitoxin system prevent-host-death family antitoxin [Rubrivivax sp.]
MSVITLDLEEGRTRLSELAARAAAGHSSLLTRHGKPIAAIVPPNAVTRSHGSASFLSLRGSGKGLWGDAPAAAIDRLRKA